MRTMRDLLRRARAESHGQSALEIAAIVPLVIIVLLLLIQGMGVAVAASQIRDAARDGARALEDGRPAGQAVMASLPDSIRLTSVSSCGRGCVRVEATTPIGIPSVMEVSRIHLSAEADFPSREGD